MAGISEAPTGSAGSDLFTTVGGYLSSASEAVAAVSNAVNKVQGVYDRPATQPTTRPTTQPTTQPSTQPTDKPAGFMASLGSGGEMALFFIGGLVALWIVSRIL